MADRALDIAYAGIEKDTVAAETIVTGVAGYKIVCVAMNLTAIGTVTVTIRDNVGLEAFGHMIAGVPYVLPASNVGWFETADGVDLELLLSAAVSVVGGITYRMIPSHASL